MKSVSIITRSIDQSSAESAFARLSPDIVRTVTVRPNTSSRFLPSNPWRAGVSFHHLLERWTDDVRLTREEQALLPWIKACRSLLTELGVGHVQTEASLAAFRDMPHGVCDILTKGGPARLGVIEAKVVTTGSVEHPRERDLAQLGAYCHLAARHRDYDQVWAAMVYVELQQRRVRLFGFESARSLIFKTTALLAA